MNIAYHCTDNYAKITMTSVVSVFENNRDADEIDVYIIEHGFTQDTKAFCEGIARKYGRQIHFIPLPDLNEDFDLNLVSIKSKWMFDSYSRLFLDRILPAGIERVLYLDGDTLVVGSLRELWEMDLEGMTCAAVADCLSPAYYELFQMKGSSRYCNSGVILIDLDQWRRRDVSNRVATYVRSNSGYVFFMEQTVFNTVLQNETCYLPASYNVTTTVQALTYEEIEKVRKPVRFYSAEELSAALSEPVIVHMTSFFLVTNRAWNEVTDHPMKPAYLSYAEKLGPSQALLAPDARSAASKVVDWFVHNLPRSLMLSVVSLVYNEIRPRRIASAANRNRKDNNLKGSE